MLPRRSIQAHIAFALATVVAPAQNTLTVPNPWPTIQAAIQAAGPQDTVLVSPGTYQESLDFLGKAIVVRAAQGPETTIIAGAGGFSVTLAKFVNNEGAASRLEGFTLSNPAGSLAGRAVFCQGASPTIYGCVLTARGSDNATGVEGISSAPSIIDCDILDNYGHPFGYGVRLVGGAPARIEKCRFVGNGGDSGGGVLLESNDAQIVDCKFDMCGSDSGGGITALGGSPTIDRCLITRCFPYGIQLDMSPGAVKSTVVSACFGTMGPGGAMRIVGASATVLHCTFAANKSGFVGSLPGYGGVVIDSASPEIKNSIFWGNRPGQLTLFGNAQPNVQRCDIEFGWPGLGNINADPAFVDETSGDYHISLNSPCHNTGQSIVDTLARDIDGEMRSLYFGPDIGADEWAPPLNLQLALDQPLGPGSLGLTTRGPLPGHLAFTVITLNTSNEGSTFGTGPWGGLHMTLGEIDAEWNQGQPPFVSSFDVTGEYVFFLVPGQVAPTMTGYSFHAITHAFDSFGVLSGVSNVASVTFM